MLRIGPRRAVVLGGGGIRYLLRDEFITDRAAGAINNMPAEPGPGNRTVTDTASQATIASGALTLAGGASIDYGDPGLWLSSVPRAAGQLLVAHFRATATTITYMVIGFDNTQTVGRGNGYYIQFKAGDPLGNLQAYDPLTADVDLGLTYAINTDYYVALRLLAAGCEYYIKGGAWSSWTQIHTTANGDGAAYYPAVLNYDHVGTIKFLRCPADLWTPSGADYSFLDTYIST